MQIRLAEKSDLPAAAVLWYERLALLQQIDPGIELLPNAVEDWHCRAASWVSDAEAAFFVAEEDGNLIGFAAVKLAKVHAGPHPSRLGILLGMAVDLHAAHRGLSGSLLDRAKQWLSTRHVDCLEIDAPSQYAVEAAFWHAQGAELRSNKYWLQL